MMRRKCDDDNTKKIARRRFVKLKGENKLGRSRKTKGLRGVEKVIEVARLAAWRSRLAI